MTKRNALFERLRLALAGYAVALLFAYAAAHSLLTSYYLDVSVLTCLAYAAGALLVFCVLFYNRYTMLATAAGLVVAVVVAYFSKFAWWISRFEEFSEALAASVPFLTGQAGLDEAYVPFLAASVCVLAALVARLTAFRFRGTGFLAVASLALFLTEWFLGHRQILLDMVLAAAAILIVLAVSFARKLYALHDDSAHAPHPDDGGDGTDEPAFVVNAPRLSVVAACVLPLALFMSALSFTALPETSDQFKNDAFVAKVDEFVLRLRGGETEGGVSTVAALGATQSTGRLGGASFQSKLPAFTISGSYPTHLRGAVYDTYTGYSFEDGGSVPFHPLAEGYTELADILFFPASERVLSRMPPASYTITPRGRTTLVYSLSVPERLIAPSDLVFFVSDQGELACETGIPAGTSYTVEGRALPAADRLTPDDLVTGGARPGYSKQLLQLPPDLPESVRALALDLVDGIENPVDRAAAIQRYLKQNFTYTLTPPAVPQGRDFVDWFLESKEGYCTYFAAAMTVLCRAADVPARYVEGFYVGTSPVGGGETVITYESAHAWCEVYLDGIGFAPVDATPESSRPTPETAPPSPTEAPVALGTSPSPPPPSGDGKTGADESAGGANWILWTVLVLLALVAAATVALLYLNRLLLDTARLETRLGPAGAARLYYARIIRAFRSSALGGLRRNRAETAHSFARRAETVTDLSIEAETDIAMRAAYGGAPPSAEELLAMRQTLGDLQARVTRRQTPVGFAFTQVLAPLVLDGLSALSRWRKRIAPPALRPLPPPR